MVLVSMLRVRSVELRKKSVNVVKTGSVDIVEVGSVDIVKAGSINIVKVSVDMVGVGICGDGTRHRKKKLTGADFSSQIKINSGIVKFFIKEILIWNRILLT